jgi:hypothetical protein
LATLHISSQKRSGTHCRTDPVKDNDETHGFNGLDSPKMALCKNGTTPPMIAAIPPTKGGFSQSLAVSQNFIATCFARLPSTLVWYSKGDVSDCGWYGCTAG